MGLPERVRVRLVWNGVGLGLGVIFWIRFLEQKFERNGGGGPILEIATKKKLFKIKNK